MLQSIFFSLHQSSLQLGLLVLNLVKLLLEPRHFIFLLFKRSVVRVVAFLHHLLQLLVGIPEFPVLQEQLLEHLSPSVGAILKKGKC